MPARWSCTGTTWALRPSCVEQIAQHLFGGGAAEHADPPAGQVFEALHGLRFVRYSTLAPSRKVGSEKSTISRRGDRHRARIAEHVDLAVAHRLEALIGRHQHELEPDLVANGGCGTAAATSMQRSTM